MEAPPPAFADPVRDSAATFRALLESTARPGRIHEIAGPSAPPAPLSPAAAAVALTLVDADAPVWLAPALRGGAAEAFLRFHCAAAPAERPEDAAFALGDWPSIAPAADRLNRGEPAWPDRAATLILMVDRLEPGAGPRLTGPGVETEMRLDPGLPPAFWALRAADPFPLGLDVVLCAGRRIAALPRSTRAKV